MRKIIVLSLILGFYFCQVFAQQSLKIEDLGSKAKKDWQLQLDLQPTLSGHYEYAVLKNGMVTYSQNIQTLSCVDFNGRKLWEKIWEEPQIRSRTTLTASPDGEYLYAYRLTGEEQGISAIWNIRGDMIWQQDGEYGYFNISPSSKYMFTYYSRLNPKPLKVLEIKTGKTLWELEKASYWQAAASQNDKLVYYTHRSLQLFELATGKLIWEKAVESDIQKHFDTSRIHISKDGRTITLQAMYTPDKGIETYVFDSEGQTLWRMNKKVIPGETNGGIIRAISDDGKFIAMSDLQRFALFSSNNPDPVWVVNERMRPQYIQEFANGMLAFRPHSNRTRVMVLNADGTINHDYLFSQRIEFKTPWPGKALVVEPDQNRVGLSLFELRLNASN